MKAAIAKRWVKALRSGEYKQGKMLLNNITTGRHCCLGVLCELAVKEKVIPPKDARIEYALFGGEDARLPQKVMEWAGMSSNWGYILKLGDELTSMNDRGARFTTIARIIEENVEAL